MEEKMIEKINKEIEHTKELYDKWKTQSFMDVAIAKIDGMMVMLELVTGKTYYYDNDGVHEK